MPSQQKRSRYGVRHTRVRRKDGHDDCFEVRANIGQLAGLDRAPVELIDSRQFDPQRLDASGFDESTRILHGVKRRDGRAEKGRIFYITAGSEVVGFVAFHVPPAGGPLIIENLVLHSGFAASTRAVARVRTVLLTALLEASDAAGRGARKLAWATDSSDKAADIARQFGFVAATRPKNTDCQLRHYLEREFGTDS